MKIKVLADRTGQDEVFFGFVSEDKYTTLKQYQQLMYALSQIEGVELDPYESRFEQYHQLPAVQK